MLIQFERHRDNEVELLCWSFIRVPAWLFNLSLHPSTSDPRESQQLEAIFQLFDIHVQVKHFQFFPVNSYFLLVITCAVFCRLCFQLILMDIAVFIACLLLASVGKATPPGL